MLIRLSERWTVTQTNALARGFYFGNATSAI